MSSLHLHCVSSGGHKESTAVPSRGMHQLWESRPHANQYLGQDSGAQRWRRSTGSAASQALPRICRKLLRPHRSAEATRRPGIRPKSFEVIADPWPNGTDASIAVWGSCCWQMQALPRRPRSMTRDLRVMPPPFAVDVFALGNQTAM